MYATPKEAAEAHDLERIKLGHPISKLNHPSSYPDYQIEGPKPSGNNTIVFLGVSSTGSRGRGFKAKGGSNPGKHLGCFRTEKEAAIAFDLFASKQSGFRGMNFPQMTENEKLKFLASSRRGHPRLPSHNTSGFCGVLSVGNRYRGRYTCFGQRIDILGTFSTKYEAAWEIDLHRLSNADQVEGRDFTLNYDGTTYQERRRTYEKVVADAAQKVRQKVSTSGKKTMKLNDEEKDIVALEQEE